MNEVIGEILPLAVGVAVCPIPIVAAILMLLLARPAAQRWVPGSAGSWGSWLPRRVRRAGRTLVRPVGEPSAAASWIKIGLGVLLLLVAVRQWRGAEAGGRRARVDGGN